jgi:hypothetical protein
MQAWYQVFSLSTHEFYVKLVCRDDYFVFNSKRALKQDEFIVGKNQLSRKQAYIFIYTYTYIYIYSAPIGNLIYA